MDSNVSVLKCSPLCGLMERSWSGPACMLIGGRETNVVASCQVSQIMSRSDMTKWSSQWPETVRPMNILQSKQNTAITSGKTNQLSS